MATMLRSFTRRRSLGCIAALALAGAVLSDSHAALNVTSLSPANGTTNICTDTLLRITFDAAPRFTNSGVVTVYTLAGDPVDTNDMSLCIDRVGSPNVQPRYLAGGSSSTYRFYTFPIIVTGNTATIFPHENVLTTNQTYYVTITPGLFTNSASGAFAGISDSTTWSFTTRASLPPANTNVLQVAADGSGDFCTVQGALNFLPASTGQHILMNISKGFYPEIVWINAKTNITLRGESRKETIIAYANNENLQLSGAGKRFLFQVTGDDCAIENLTLTNSTPDGGSQAEALRMGSRRFIANNCDIDSYQDTILVNSSSRYAYFYNCLVQGDVDFIWNDACAVFQGCEIKALTSGGYNCQMRTPDTNHNGAIFLDCSLTRAAGVASTYFNRIDPGAYPDCMVAYVNCKMDSHILSVGWQLDNFTTSSPTNSLRLWEYQSTDLSGTLLNVSGRAGCSRQISAAEAGALRNLTNVFGVNLQWLPQLAPNLITPPTNQSVLLGSNVTFTVTATGIETANPAVDGDPSIIVPLSYQWLKNGTNLVGETNVSLAISNLLGTDAGYYSVVVSNLSGVVVSSEAFLTIIGANTAPVFGGAADQTVNVGVNVSVTNTATDSDIPAQTLTYSLLNGPAGSLLSTNTGEFTWRPDVSFSDTTNLVEVAVTDDGFPSLGDTQSFHVIVNPLVQATIGSVVKSGSQLTFAVSGQAGPDYAVQTSTNLTNWSTVLITNSPAMPWSWTDTNIGAQPVLFYRIKAGPPLP